MATAVDQCLAISRRVAQEVDSRLNVAGLASVDGQAARAEVLLTMTGCHREPCSIIVNVARGEPAIFERELATQLQAVVAHHVLKA